MNDLGFPRKMLTDLPITAWRTQVDIRKDRERYSCQDQTKQLTELHRPLTYYKGKRILLWTRKPGLGDMVMNAICCDILRRQHGIDVWFGCRGNPYDRHFVEFLKGIPSYGFQPDLTSHPLPNQLPPRGYEGGLDHTGQKHPFDLIIDFRYHVGLEKNTLFQCLEEFGVSRLKVPCSGLPVHNLPQTREIYDVVLGLDCGGWKPVRGYRRGAELEKLLRKAGFKVLNLSKSVTKPPMKLSEILAHVSAAKLYIGVETGLTHLVSGVHQKALVIQAGIHRSAFWNVYDKTHVVEGMWSCGGRRCKVRKHQECKIAEGVCIDRFAPGDIGVLATKFIGTDMSFETTKCTVRRLAQGHLQKLVGRGIDVGSGKDPFRPLSGTCQPWDKAGSCDAATLQGIRNNTLDYVYSSHCLEHLPDPLQALNRWSDVIKKGGYLYVAVPDFDLYEGGVKIRNQFHKSAFSLHRPTDLKIPLFNVMSILTGPLSKKLWVRYVALCDDNFNAALSKDIDQTQRGAVCHIEFMLQKK